MLSAMAVKPADPVQPRPVNAILTNPRPADRRPVRAIDAVSPRPPAQKPPVAAISANHEGQTAAAEIMSFYKRPTDKVAPARPSGVGRRLDVVG